MSFDPAGSGGSGRSERNARATPPRRASRPTTTMLRAGRNPSRCGTMARKPATEPTLILDCVAADLADLARAARAAAERAVLRGDLSPAGWLAVMPAGCDPGHRWRDRINPETVRNGMSLHSGGKRIDTCLHGPVTGLVKNTRRKPSCTARCVS